MTLHKHREAIDQLVAGLQEHDAQHGTFTFAAELAETAAAEAGEATSSSTTAVGKHPRRPSAVIARAVDLTWLATKIDAFKPRSWWVASMHIVLRIALTSGTVFFTHASAKAAVATLIAITGMCVQLRAAPYRRPSDNDAAVAAAWVLFMWTWVLLMRCSGAVGGEHGFVLGGLLIAATVLLIGGVVRLLVLDVWEDAATNNAEREAEDETGLANTAEPNNEDAIALEVTTLVAVESRAGGPPPSRTGEEGATAVASSSRLAETSPEDSNFLLGMLCVAGPTQQPDEATATSSVHADENARLREENASLREEIARLLRLEKAGQ